MESLAADRLALPAVFERWGRLDADEPYRLKCSYIRERLVRTARRTASGNTPRAGLDYSGVDEIVADLDVMYRSLNVHHGAVIAEGLVARVIRTVRAVGLQLATMDVREHTARHHHALAALFDRLGSGDHYRGLDRAGRTRLLAERTGRRATARPADRGARRGGGGDHCGLLHDQRGARPVRRRSDRELHRLDGQGRRRRPRRRRARTRRWARRPQFRCRPHRPRPAARDHRRADLRRAAARRAAARAVVPANGGATGRHARGDARILRLEQGRWHHRFRVGDPPGAARHCATLPPTMG